MTEMFDPVTTKPGKIEALPQWRPILPVPAGAPAPPAEHPRLGKPAAVWTYRNAAGALLLQVLRFDLAAGKEMRPLVYAENMRRGREWRWQQVSRPRPLYGLDRLAQRPNAPVIITEGEKAADAAGVLLPSHVAVTSPGGAKAATLADWSPLAGREVVIWPDADQAGADYAAAVSRALAKLTPAARTRIVSLPAGLASGFDAADALAAGWADGRAAALIAAAPAVEAGVKRGARDAALEIIEMFDFWHDSEPTGYASIPVGGHVENIEIDGRTFRNLVAWRFFGETGRSLGAATLDEIVRIGEGIAINRGPEHPTWRRVGALDAAIYLDLGRPDWGAVEITATGWRLAGARRPKFLRSRGTASLPLPEAGAPIEQLRAYVNVECDGDFVLLCSWLVAALRPTGPYPVLVLVGQQGSSKSTTARVLRMLADPNTAPIRALPKDERDLLVSAINASMLAFDNLSSMPAWLADAFCRLSTGGGFATRELHSDRSETIFSATRPILCNGIPDLTQRSDLAERAIVLTLPPIPDDQRKDEATFWAEFERDRPAILGALLDAVSAGLRHLADTVLTRSPRMADFARWAVACSAGFGWTAGEFLNAYEVNRADVAAGSVEASPLIAVIEAVLGRGGVGPEGFSGRATDLLAKFRDVTPEGQQRQRWFPEQPGSVGGAIRRLTPLLETRGIIVEHAKVGRKRERIMMIRCATPANYDALQARMRGMPEGS